MKKKLYAIVDLETTGGKASRDKITEIGIVLHDGEQIIDTFETLVNPECYIPYGITQLTGITQDMVVDAPKFYEVAKEVVQKTEGAILVAHNARFDYSFLRAEFSRLGYTFSRKQLCTVRLTRTVFPEIGKYSLEHLIRHFGIQVNDRHRAMADALATSKVLEYILARQTGEASIKDLVNLGIKESLLPENLTVEKIHQLPEECGVYYFHNQAGQVVYVGKSINIQKRVAEHFAQKTQKASNLQKYVHDISFELTGSELIALLHESFEIKRLRPMINRAQRMRNFPHIVFTYVNDDGYRCFDITKVTAKTRKNYQVVAEYPKASHAKGSLKRMIDTYQLCPLLCNIEKGRGPCFSFHLKKCAGACADEESPESYNERADQAMQHMTTIFDQDFFLLDLGRRADEVSVVLVEDGRLQGFGYIDKSEAVEQVEMLRASVKPCTGNAETTRIIQRYMSGNSNIKLIHF